MFDFVYSTALTGLYYKQIVLFAVVRSAGLVLKGPPHGDHGVDQGRPSDATWRHRGDTVASQGDPTLLKVYNKQNIGRAALISITS